MMFEWDFEFVFIAKILKKLKLIQIRYVVALLFPYRSPVSKKGNKDTPKPEII